MVRVFWAACEPHLAGQRAAARALAASAGVVVRGPGVSHAHSGDVVLLAVDEGGATVGADVERVAGRRVLPATLTEQERAWIGDDVRRFVTAWVAKEAAVKALGTGFAGAGGPRAVDVPPPPAGCGAAALGGVAAGLWARWLDDAPPGYVAAVVASGPDVVVATARGRAAGGQSPGPRADCS